MYNEEEYNEEESYEQQEREEECDESCSRGVAEGGRKKALICAVTYKGTKGELKGCINDMKCMKYLLINRLHFPESSVLVLSEEDENDVDRLPTKRNIEMGLEWLMEGCQAGDSLVFAFSGHGSQQKSTDGDELDGFDENLVPMDYKEEGKIVDNYLNETLVRPLPEGARLHAIMDCCHSGTVLDLPYLCSMNSDGEHLWEEDQAGSRWKGTSGGEVFCLSGCRDDQTSADTKVLSGSVPTGALIFSFIKAIENGEAGTYGELLHSIRSTIASTRRLKQVVQLTTNERFDVFEKAFYL